MNIAVLGWGSLVWCPGSLRIRTRWRADGPMMPIEFARISQDGRLTLVIHPGSPDQTTYWAGSELRKMGEARKNLCERENSRLDDIHYALRDGRVADGVSREIALRVCEWMARQSDIQGAVWTGLPSNWMEKRRRDFTPEDAVNYLLEMKACGDPDKARYIRAREYVTNTPPLINTVVRQTLRTRGWDDARLPTILFQDAPSLANAKEK